jgi:hypothetical protein
MPAFPTFKDLSVTFKKHPVTDDLVTVKDKAAIAQSIKGLLLTKKGERPFQAEIGSNIMDLLFEPLDYGTGAMLKKEIQKCLTTYEGRIIITRLVSILDFDNNGYDIELEYMIVGRSDQPVAVDFFLSRTR